MKTILTHLVTSSEVGRVMKIVAWEENGEIKIEVK